MAIYGLPRRARTSRRWRRRPTILSRSSLLPPPAAHPSKSWQGPDGNLWSLRFMAIRIVPITTGGAITEFPVHPHPLDDHTAGAGTIGYVKIIEIELLRDRLAEK